MAVLGANTELGGAFLDILEKEKFLYNDIRLFCLQKENDIIMKVKLRGYDISIEFFEKRKINKSNIIIICQSEFLSKEHLSIFLSNKDIKILDITGNIQYIKEYNNIPVIIPKIKNIDIIEKDYPIIGSPSSVGIIISKVLNGIKHNFGVIIKVLVVCETNTKNPLVSVNNFDNSFIKFNTETINKKSKCCQAEEKRLQTEIKLLLNIKSRITILGSVSFNTPQNVVNIMVSIKLKEKITVERFKNEVLKKIKNVKYIENMSDMDILSLNKFKELNINKGETILLYGLQQNNNLRLTDDFRFYMMGNYYSCGLASNGLEILKIL